MRSLYTGIVTLAYDFPSNQLQAGDLGVQNTFNMPTDILYFRHLTPGHQFTGSSISLRSSKRLLLQVPRTRTAYGSRAFSVAVLNILE